MDWSNIIITLICSGTVSGIVSAIASRPKTTAEKKRIEAEAEGSLTDHYDNYAERLETRIQRLEQRQDMSERREGIFKSAIACAYRCACKECPVLEYLAKHPLPEK